MTITAKDNLLSTFERFTGKPVSAEKVIRYPEKTFKKTQRVTMITGYEPVLAMYVQGRLVEYDVRPVRETFDIVTGTEKKRVRETSLKFTGRAAAGLAREAEKNGLRLRFIPEGHVRAGMSYDPSRVNVQLSKDPSRKNGYRISGIDIN